MTVTDPQALAKLLEGLGAEVLYDQRDFRFEIPISECRRVIPEIHRWGLRAEEVAQRQGRDFNGKIASVVTLKLMRQPEEPDWDGGSLMAKLIK